MNEEQEAIMGGALAALESIITTEEIDAILSEEPTVDVRVGLAQNKEKLAVLVTFIKAASAAGLDELLYRMTDLVFLAGWNSAMLMKKEVH